MTPGPYFLRAVTSAAIFIPVKDLAFALASNPPLRVSAIVNPSGHIEITFDKPIQPAMNPTGFSIWWNGCYEKTLETGDGILGWIESITITGNVAAVVTNVTVKIGERMTDAYAPGNVTDLDGNALAAYEPQEIDNQSERRNTSMMALL